MFEETREEHIKWCKERAKEEFEYYMNNGGIEIAIRNGLASMASDLRKHSETNNETIVSFIILQRIYTREGFMQFIDGFN